MPSTEAMKDSEYSERRGGYVIWLIHYLNSGRR